MTYTSDDARAYIAAVRWQFASTMPRIPHWYTVRKWSPEFDGAFVAFVRQIRSGGIRMDWPDPPAKPLYRNQYLLLDGWKYWTMGDPHPGVPPIETPETHDPDQPSPYRASARGSNAAHLKQRLTMSLRSRPTLELAHTDLPVPLSVHSS